SLPLSALAHQWEDTGSTLKSTLSNYHQLCLCLSEASGEIDMTKKDLVSYFDSALQPGALLSTLFSQLKKSQEVLSKARNRLVSPIYNFPSEILSKIFLHFVYDKDSDTPLYVEFTIRTFYHRLYTLLGVCSVWRNIGVSTPMLWNLIPVIRDVRFTLSNRATSRSLRRSGMLPLDLAVMIPHLVPDLLVARLTKYAPRFRTINILSEEPYTIRKIMHPLLHQNVSESLSELSLCVTDLENIDRLSNSPYYMFLPESPEHPLLLELLQSLTRFRFNGATFDWSQITFSSRLVEVRVHSVILGNDSSLHAFLRAISTAPKLQKLELVSVMSFPDPGLLDDAPQVELPELQSLVLIDLYFNTLSTLLRSITPLSHRLTLCLTENSRERIFSARDPDIGRESVNVTDLRATFQGICIDTLLLMGQEKNLNYVDLILALDVVQSLNTIKMDDWAVDETFCRAFTRLQPKPREWSIAVPKIQNLFMTNVKISDQEGLKELVHSHDLKMILLGGQLNCGSEESEDWEPLKGSEDIVDWLVNRVPNVRLVPDDEFTPPEFLFAVWRLW
ncbi:hypothetical protein FRC11_008912, partial [Ceratobasidium sp. 423]